MAAALACTASLAAAQTAGAQTAGAHPTARAAAWQQVGDGITSGISGIAVAPGSRAGATDVLVVRDNKRAGENRLASIRLRTGAKPEVRPLAWQGGKAPADLEALDSVPGRPGEYVALTSSGKGYHLRTTGSDAARVLGTFTVPGASKNDNYEGFALTSRAHRLIAVWADRGENSRPGTLHAATLDLGRHTFSSPVTAPFHAPYPATDVRHISDVKTAPSGALTVSSASDTGDDGPFDSAVYDAGKVTLDRNGAVRLSVRRSPAPLARYTGHKIEALACLPHSREGVLGTDDENAGGAIRTVTGTLCRFR